MALIEKEWLEDLLLAHEQNARSIQASGRKVSFTYADGIRTAYADVGLCPSVDAVVVVRCKDCKYKKGSVCEYSAVYVHPNGFCNLGTRKGEEE